MTDATCRLMTDSRIAGLSRIRRYWIATTAILANDGVIDKYLIARGGRVRRKMLFGAVAQERAFRREKILNRIS